MLATEAAALLEGERSRLTVELDRARQDAEAATPIIYLLPILKSVI